MNRNKSAVTLRTSLSLVAAAVIAALAVGCASVADGFDSQAKWEMPIDRGTGGDGGQG